MLTMQIEEDDDIAEALEMSVEALKELDVPDTNVGDMISRRAAIDALFELYEYQRYIDPTEAADRVRQGVYLTEKKIEQLPSVQPEREKGRWIDMGDHVMCSCCGATHYGVDKNYCSNCGADMRGEEND